MTTSIDIRTAGHRVKVEKLHLREGEDPVLETVYIEKDSSITLYVHSGLSIGGIEETGDAVIPVPEPVPTP